MPESSIDPRSLVQPDRVHRSVYTDASLFELEMTRVFGRSWIYLAHASQVPEPGSLFATRIGREPVLVVRQNDGTIRALLNRCAHKGMQLCADGTSGRKRVLHCGYHGWTYQLDGRVRTVPVERGYEGTQVSRGSVEAGLTPIGAVAEYRGFIFGRLHPDGPDLLTWLGPMRSSLDNFVDRAPDDRVEVAGGVLRYVHNANWKFFVENTLDALHSMVVHQSAAVLSKKVQNERVERGMEVPLELRMMVPFGAPYSFFNDMGQRGSAFGHADLGNSSSLHSDYDLLNDYVERLTRARGVEAAQRILGISRNNSVLYPSIMFKAPVSLLRVIKPLAVDKTLIETWHFRLCGAPDDLLQRTIRYSTIVNSSAGPVGPDDHSVYKRLHSGLQAQGSDWVVMARYPGQETADGEGARATRGTSDFVYRNQFAAWADYMGEETR
jgi:benzoate/toluate 1,2-dioxygenase alpha subunit